MWIGSYGRLSRERGETDPKAVVAHQLDACDRMAREDGVTIPPENRLAEIGTGESLAERPLFAAWLNRWERDPPPGGGRLYVPEIPRLTRADLEEIGRIVRILAGAGIHVRVPGHTYNLSISHDWWFFTSQALQGTYENKVYKERVSRKMSYKFENAEIRCGRVPWGYRWNKERQQIEADPEAFPLLAALCQEVLSQGIPQLSHRYGIAPSTLYRVLTNPTLCGYPALRYRSRPGQGGGSLLPRREWQLPTKRNDSYPHACTRAEWEAIQTVMEERWCLKTKTTGRDGWCRSVVRFQGIDGRPSLGSSHFRNRPVVPLYEVRLPTYGGGKKGPGKRLAWIERATVHAAALAALQELFAEPATVKVLIDLYLTDLANERAKNGSQSPADALLLRLETLTAQYEESVEAEFSAAEPLRSALKKRRLRLETELAELKSQAKERERESAHARQTIEQLRALPDVAERFQSGWNRWDEGQRRRVVELVIERIDCHYQPAPGPALPGVREVAQVVPQPWFRRKGKQE